MAVHNGIPGLNQAMSQFSQPQQPNLMQRAMAGFQDGGFREKLPAIIQALSMFDQGQPGFLVQPGGQTQMIPQGPGKASSLAAMLQMHDDRISKRKKKEAISGALKKIGGPYSEAAGALADAGEFSGAVSLATAKADKGEVPWTLMAEDRQKEMRLDPGDRYLVKLDPTSGRPMDFKKLDEGEAAPQTREEKLRERAELNRVDLATKGAWRELPPDEVKARGKRPGDTWKVKEVLNDDGTFSEVDIQRAAPGRETPTEAAEIEQAKSNARYDTRLAREGVITVTGPQATAEGLPSDGVWEIKKVDGKTMAIERVQSGREAAFDRLDPRAQEAAVGPQSRVMQLSKDGSFTLTEGSVNLQRAKALEEERIGSTVLIERTGNMLDNLAKGGAASIDITAQLGMGLQGARSQINALADKLDPSHSRIEDFSFVKDFEFDRLSQWANAGAAVQSNQIHLGFTIARILNKGRPTEEDFKKAMLIIGGTSGDPGIVRTSSLEFMKGVMADYSIRHREFFRGEPNQEFDWRKHIEQDNKLRIPGLFDQSGLSSDEELEMRSIMSDVFGAP